jgi:predicted acylesterase/phospholipase RssA
MPIQIRCRGRLLLMLLLLGGCSESSINVPETSLQKSVSERRFNTNPRTESFVRESVGQGAPEQLLRAPSTQQGSSDVDSPPVHDDDGYFVGLAISGGGSRSANFAAGCMFQLQRVGMLQKVNCISAVSGGTLTAAYYCSANDKDWNPQTVQEKLTHPFASDLIGRALWPWNIIKLSFGTLTRADLLADDFSSVLFQRKGRVLTFGDLRPDRPRLLINSTDMQTGKRFTFCNADFDSLNSNLDSLPLGYAVCASSAVPVVMTPVTLQDYSTTFPHFYHLVDGGIYDNLGVRILVESYEAQIHRKINPYPRGAIIIVIDAGTQFDGHLSSQASIGWLDSIKEGLGLSSTILLNRVSTSTMSEMVAMHSYGGYSADELRAKIDQLFHEHYVELLDSKKNNVRIIHLSLGQVGELSDSAFGSSVNGIATYFNIDSDSAYMLYKSAEILFTQRFDARLMPLVQEMSKAATTTEPMGEKQ